MIDGEIFSLRRMNRRCGASFFVGGLAFVVAALVFFTELSLSAEPIATLTLELAVTMFCCIVMYGSMADAGAEIGEEREEVKRAIAEWKGYATAVRERGLSSGLSAFCRRLAEQERREVRCDLFASIGLSLADGLALSGDKARYKALPRRSRRIVSRAARLSLLRLSPELLLYGARDQRRRTLLPPTARDTRRRAMARAMPSAILGSLLTVSVAMTCRSGIDAAAVISAILRLLALLSTGVRGYGMGYRSVTEEGVRSASVRACYLSRYLAECDGAGEAPC